MRIAAENRGEPTKPSDANHRPLRAPGVGVASGPDARNEGGGELAAANEADGEGAESEPIVHMQRQRGKGDAGDEENHEHSRHQRQEGGNDRAGLVLRFERGGGHYERPTA